MPVQVSTLRTTKVDAVDLFMQYEAGQEPRLYCRAGTRPDSNDFTKLAAQNVSCLFIRGADFALLVTEPTPFGLHDLKQVVGVVKELGIPAGVVVNRDGIGDNAVETYCVESELPVLMRIPMDRQVAEGIAQGNTLVEIKPEFNPALRDMLEQIVQRVA